METRDVALHSVGVNYSGTRRHLSYLGGGYLIADSNKLARGDARPRFRLITPVAHRVPYTNPGAHSAVKVPGRPYVVLTEEVYGDFLDELIGADEHGCPWGWVKIADVRDERQPEVVGEFRLRETLRPTASRQPDRTRATPGGRATPHTTPPCCRIWRW